MHKETCQWSIQKSEYHKIFLFASLFLFTATETPILQYMVFLHYPVCFSVLDVSYHKHTMIFVTD
jgi:hypothetical protein